MSELRERFRVLDDLDVPDVMSRARLMGPKPPDPDRPPPLRRIGALVFAAIVAIAAVVLIARALDERTQPADPPTPTPDTALRRGGEVITFTGGDPWSEGDLVAQDPDTGSTRTLIAADRLSGPVNFERLTVGSAAWSPDGQWVAYEIVTCLGGFNAEAGDGGLWVTNGVEEPRQLTTPCSEKPDLHGLWAWSPVGPQLIAVEGDALVLIDPATGERTDLGEPAADITAVAWSPDGSGSRTARAAGRSIRWARVAATTPCSRARSDTCTGDSADSRSSGRQTVRTSRSMLSKTMGKRCIS